MMLLPSCLFSVEDSWKIDASYSCSIVIFCYLCFLRFNYAIEVNYCVHYDINFQHKLAPFS